MKICVENISFQNMRYFDTKGANFFSPSLQFPYRRQNGDIGNKDKKSRFLNWIKASEIEIIERFVKKKTPLLLRVRSSNGTR